MMKGFASEIEVKRYAHLFALSLLLSQGEDFWFDGELYEACENRDLKKVRRALVKANPAMWMFADLIDWAELAKSAITIWTQSKDEHNALLERLGLLSGGEA